MLGTDTCGTNDSPAICFAAACSSFSRVALNKAIPSAGPSIQSEIGRWPISQNTSTSCNTAGPERRLSSCCWRTSSGSHSSTIAAVVGSCSVSVISSLTTTGSVILTLTFGSMDSTSSTCQVWSNCCTNFSRRLSSLSLPFSNSNRGLVMSTVTEVRVLGGSCSKKSAAASAGARVRGIASRSSGSRACQLIRCASSS